MERSRNEAFFRVANIVYGTIYGIFLFCSDYFNDIGIVISRQGHLHVFYNPMKCKSLEKSGLFLYVQFHCLSLTRGLIYLRETVARTDSHVADFSELPHYCFLGEVDVFDERF